MFVLNSVSCFEVIVKELNWKKTFHLSSSWLAQMKLMKAWPKKSSSKNLCVCYRINVIWSWAIWIVILGTGIFYYVILESWFNGDCVSVVKLPRKWTTSTTAAERRRRATTLWLTPSTNTSPSKPPSWSTANWRSTRSDTRTFYYPQCCHLLLQNCFMTIKFITILIWNKKRCNWYGALYQNTMCIDSTRIQDAMCVDLLLVEFWWTVLWICFTDKGVGVVGFFV